jgi:hypothetical protein
VVAGVEKEMADLVGDRTAEEGAGVDASGAGNRFDQIDAHTGETGMTSRRVHD